MALAINHKPEPAAREISPSPTTEQPPALSAPIWEQWEYFYRTDQRWRILDTAWDFADRLARRLFIPGGEHADLVQEAMIGIWRGLEHWRPDGGLSLYQFLKLAAWRKIGLAVTKANRPNQLPLTDALSYDVSLVRHAAAGDALTLLDRIPGEPSCEEEVLRRLESDEELSSKLDTLRASIKPSSMEAHLLEDLVQFPPDGDDVDYPDRVERLGLRPKSIDNTLRRIRLRAQKLGLRTGKPLVPLAVWKKKTQAQRGGAT